MAVDKAPVSDRLDERERVSVLSGLCRLFSTPTTDLLAASLRRSLPGSPDRIRQDAPVTGALCKLRCIFSGRIANASVQHTVCV